MQWFRGGLVFEALCSGSEAGSYLRRSGSEAGSYLRRKDSCITQLKAQGTSRTCNESEQEEKNKPGLVFGVWGLW